jgi:hypothetical protein
MREMESRQEDNTDDSHVKTDEEGKSEPNHKTKKKNSKKDSRNGRRPELVRNGSELQALKVDNLMDEEIEEEEEDSCKCCCEYNSESPSCCSNQVENKTNTFTFCNLLSNGYKKD